MIISIIISKLRLNVVFSVMSIAILTSVGCTGVQKMAIVEHNLQQGKFSPEAAVQVADFLNLYEHDYPLNSNQPLAVEVTLDRTKVLSTGGDGLLQIALITRPALIKKSQLHFRLYDESLSSKRKVLLLNMLKDSKHYIASLPKGSELSVNTAFTEKGFLENNSTKEKPLYASFEEYMKTLTQQDYSQSGNKIVLVVGDIGSLSVEQKQNIIDMTRILHAKGVKISVISYDESPDFSFYNKISEVGNGFYRIHKENFNVQEWIKNEVHDLHASSFSDVEITIKSKNSMYFSDIVSPRDLTYERNKIKIKLDKITEGSKYVLLAKVKFLKLIGSPKTKILSISGEYFDNKSNRYNKIAGNKYIKYVFDKNSVPASINPRIERSNLILKTQSVIADVAKLIRARRYYYAIALMTAQQRALVNYVSLQYDAELSRDADILASYSNKLYDFDDNWIQFWHIKRDLNWDTARYNGDYQ